MAKFLKSIFNSSEKKKEAKHEGDSEEDRTDDLPLDGRRKLSLSRSGRLKQANRKRHSLSLLELYGENAPDTTSTENSKTMENHWHEPLSAPADMDGETLRRNSADYHRKNMEIIHSKTVDFERDKLENQNKHKRLSADANSLVEEIDNAFEIIDKS